MKELLITQKKINWDECPILFKSKPNENWLDEWMPMNGTWYYEDGAIIGFMPENKGGIIFSKQCFDRDVIMKCKISAVLPATRDVNAVIHGHWNNERNYIGDSYLCGLNGWWDDKAGIERIGHDSALIPLFKYKPGSEVEMIFGSIKGHTFMFIDDQLVIEWIDRNSPLTEGHVGFSAYCTKLRITEVEVREAQYTPRNQRYVPEFEV